MIIAETRREQMFPCLSNAQIAVAERFAPEAPRRSRQASSSSRWEAMKPLPGWCSRAA